MKKTKFLFIIFALSMLFAPSSEAQLLKKLKQAVTGETPQTSSNSSSATPSAKASSKMIGESEINDEFVADEFGLNGIYYAQFSNGITKNKFEFSLCKDKSKAKGAENMPACISFKYEIPESNTTIWRNTVHNDGYAHPESLLRTKKLYFSGQGYGDMFQIEPGVIFMSPSNYKGVIIGTEPSFKKEDFDWKYYVEYGSFYVKNKEDLKKWSYSEEVKEIVKTALTELSESISSIYSEVEGKKMLTTKCHRWVN